MVVTQIEKGNKMSKKPPPIIGSFGKGIEGSISINFGVSGGADCDTLCKHHPESVAKDATHLCYAARSGRRSKVSRQIAQGKYGPENRSLPSNFK
jgi:hypothetical protein